MSKNEINKVNEYEKQKQFFQQTLIDLLETLDEEDAPKMKSICDSAAHCAPEVTYRMWSKLFQTLSCNFKKVSPDGKHFKTVEIYNSKYKEFVKTWYNDNTD
jgi:hypothetical protein